MSSPRLVAAGLAFGNYIQGWHASALAGALLYIKPEFHLEHNATVQGFIVSSSVIGCICSASAAGILADKFGRRKVLSFAGILLFFGPLGMALSPNIITLICFRILMGCAEGLVAAIVPLLLAETAPTDIRGQLATFPQLSTSSGTFSGYFITFVLSLIKGVSWRVMVATLMVPSLMYISLCLFYIPESPRWLVSKGNMNAAKKVLQNLLNKEEVAGELALLVEGLATNPETVIEEYVIEPKDWVVESIYQKNDTKTLELSGIEDEQPWVAKPASVLSKEQWLPRLGGKVDNHTRHYSSVDPTVAIARSLQSRSLEGHSAVDLSAYQWDFENQSVNEADNLDADEENDGNIESVPDTPVSPGGLRTPLLYGTDSDFTLPKSRKCLLNWGENSARGLDSRPSLRNISRSSVANNAIVSVPGSKEEGLGFGGGWQLAWQWQEPDKKNLSGSFKRVFLFPEGTPPPPSSAVSSMKSLTNLGVQEPVHVAALVGEAAFCMSEKELKSKFPEHGSVVGPAVVHPSKMAENGVSFSDFMDIRVKKALVIGTSLQFLQQFCGIGAVIYFTPQILEQSGIDDFLVKHGLARNSASLLASAVTCLPMLPFIVLSMFLMDRAGRRQLLLYTTPVLFTILLSVSIMKMLLRPGTLLGIVLVLGVTLFLCFFNMAFGPVPNIITSEIFPTRVRGVALGICVFVGWVCNMIISFMFPVLNGILGLSGVLALFGVMCAVSWLFVYKKVPETKGFPLEVITEMFAASTDDKQRTV